MIAQRKHTIYGILALLTGISLLCCSCERLETTGENRRLGFSTGNIGQGGLMCGDGNGNVYYRSEADHWHLYRAGIDGSGKTKLADDVPCSINVLGGWVYYANYSDGFAIYRIRTDGASRTRLKEGYCHDLYVVGDTIYYSVRDEKNTVNIHSMKVDGSQDKLIVPGAWLMYFWDGRLYYLGEKLYLWMYDLDSGQPTQLNSSYTHYVTVDADGISCWYPDENKFVRMSHDGAESQVLVSGGDHFNASDDAVYYMRLGGDYNFYRLSPDTATEVRLTTFMTDFFDGTGVIVKDPASVEDVFEEGGASIFVIDGHAFVRGTLRRSLLETGRLDCLINLDGTGAMDIWD